MSTSAISNSSFAPPLNYRVYDGSKSMNKQVITSSGAPEIELRVQGPGTGAVDQKPDYEVRLQGPGTGAGDQKPDYEMRLQGPEVDVRFQGPNYEARLQGPNVHRHVQIMV